eukprot:PhM_4_TR15675/c0_g1_i3/m.12125
MSRKHILTIVNKHSGPKMAGEIYSGSVFQYLYKNGIPNEVIHFEQEPGVLRQNRDCHNLLERAVENDAMILILGGDGTVSETLNALVPIVKKKKTLGSFPSILPIPCGATNSLASTLGFTSVNAALDTMAGYAYEFIDTTPLPLWKFTVQQNEKALSQSAYFHAYFNVGYWAAMRRDVCALREFLNGFANLPVYNNPHKLCFAKQVLCNPVTPLAVQHEAFQDRFGFAPNERIPFTYLTLTQLHTMNLYQRWCPSAMRFDKSKEEMSVAQGDAMSISHQVFTPNKLFGTAIPQHIGRRDLARFVRFMQDGSHVHLPFVKSFEVDDSIYIQSKHTDAEVAPATRDTDVDNVFVVDGEELCFGSDVKSIKIEATDITIPVVRPPPGLAIR